MSEKILFITHDRMSKLITLTKNIWIIKNLVNIFSKISLADTCGCKRYFYHSSLCLIWYLNTRYCQNITIDSLKLLDVQVSLGNSPRITINRNKIFIKVGLCSEGIDIIGDPYKVDSKYDELIESKGWDNTYNRFTPNMKSQYKLYNNCEINQHKLKYLNHYIKSDSSGRSTASYQFEFDLSDNKYLQEIKNVKLIRKILRKQSDSILSILPKEVIYYITEFVLQDVISNLGNITSELASGSSNSINGSYNKIEYIQDLINKGFFCLTS